MRTVPAASLIRLLARGSPDLARELETTARIDDEGQIAGAMITWVDGLAEKTLTTVGGWSALQAWLGQDRPAGDPPPQTRAAAELVVFDYLIGNWDRFSGGNVYLDPQGPGLVLLDNNGSFKPWSDRQEQRMDTLLQKTERFPAPLIEKLRKLDAQAVETALAAEPWHRASPLLNDQHVELLLSRRDRLLAHLDSLLEKYGPEAVLFSP
jgi:hypothetical protein